MQSYKYSKLSSKLSQRNEKSHTAGVSKEISLTNNKPSTPRTNEEVIAFHAHRHKILKKPKISDAQTNLFTEKNMNKFTFCNLFKFNQAIESGFLPKGISLLHPTNINIQNININNIHYHSGSNALKQTKESIMIKDKNDKHCFPIITPIQTSTAPKIENISNRNMQPSKGIAKKKIRLVDLDKLKKKPLKIEEKILSNKKIEVVEDNNDSFFDEVVDLLHNVEEKPKNKEIGLDNINVESPLMTEANTANKNSNINIADICRVNAQRPQTSYGGLSERKKSIQNSLRQKSSKQTTERLVINLPEQLNN